MAYMGINFRATSGYVTDRGSDTYCLGEQYTGSVIRAGLAFGFVGATCGVLDRVNTNDPELAGVCYVDNSGATLDFRLDIPATWTVSDVKIAVGDAGNSQQVRCLIKNDTTTIATVNNTQTIQDFYDATNAARAHTAWYANNVAVSTTLSSGILRLTIGGHVSATTFSTVAHVGVTYTISGGGPGIDPQLKFQARLQAAGRASIF